MKRILFTAATLAIVAGGSALAADLPQPGPPPPQAPAYVPLVAAPVYNWGGVYYGINGGYGIGSSDWTTSYGAASGSFNVKGFLVGPTVGANIQADAFVFGVEGDFDASWMNGTNSICASAASAACETKNTWLATARARAGYAVDRVLFYGTAGGAFGDILGNTLWPSSNTFQSKIVPGWTAGAGVEAAFTDHWTARIEYLFVDLENASLPGQGPTTITVKYDNVSLIRFGLDYKFR